MAPQRKNAAQDTTIAPASPKEKGKAIEVAKPASRHPNLSDIHITDAEDSQSSSVSSQRVLTVVPEPRYTNEQLLQMLSSLQKQLEEQKMEMGPP